MNITEDSENIYIENYTIPKGREKEDIKAREKIINAIYRKWTAENFEKCLFNNDLKDFIYVKFESINETVNKAARSYQSTVAMFHLTEILKDAKVVKRDKPDRNTKNQAKYTQMIIMQWEKVKLIRATARNFFLFCNYLKTKYIKNSIKYFMSFLSVLRNLSIFYCLIFNIFHFT